MLLQNFVLWITCTNPEQTNHFLVSKMFLQSPLKSRFDTKLLCFRFILFQIYFLKEEFHFVLKFKQFHFVMRSKPKREKLDFSRVTSLLSTRTILNTPGGQLTSSHEFSKEDDEKVSKYFYTNCRFVSNYFFYSKTLFCFVSSQKTLFRTPLVFTVQLSTNKTFCIVCYKVSWKFEIICSRSVFLNSFVSVDHQANLETSMDPTLSYQFEKRKN